MASWQSIRFRLSVQYSAVVFGLGGAILGLVYWALQRELRSQTMMARIQTGQRVGRSDGELVIRPEFKAIEVCEVVRSGGTGKPMWPTFR